MRDKRTLFRQAASARPVSSPVADRAEVFPSDVPSGDLPAGDLPSGDVPSGDTSWIGAVRYGYRPPVAGRRLHCVLPGGPTEHHEGRPIGWAWCGAPVYLDNGADVDWGHWPACEQCAPGYQRHLILRLVTGTTRSGVTEHAVARQLPSVPVHERLADLYQEGIVVRGDGPGGHPLYRANTLSTTAIGYLGTPR